MPGRRQDNHGEDSGPAFPTRSPSPMDSLLHFKLTAMAPATSSACRVLPAHPSRPSRPSPAKCHSSEPIQAAFLWEDSASPAYTSVQFTVSFPQFPLEGALPSAIRWESCLPPLLKAASTHIVSLEPEVLFWPGWGSLEWERVQKLTQP